MKRATLEVMDGDDAHLSNEENGIPHWGDRSYLVRAPNPSDPNITESALGGCYSYRQCYVLLISFQSATKAFAVSIRTPPSRKSGDEELMIKWCLAAVPFPDRPLVTGLQFPQ